MRKFFDNRIARFFVLFPLTLGGYIAAQLFFVKQLARIPLAYRDGAETAAHIVLPLILLLFYWIATRDLEHRPVRELAPSRAPVNLIAGAAVGIALFATVIGVLAAMGVAHVGHFDKSQSLIPALNMATLSGVGEELIFRGVLYRLFEEMFGSLTALIVSSALFGAAHLGNEGATLASAACVTIEAGFLLGACYLATRNLWLPIGLHFGWNFAEGGIFGSVVSGNPFQGVLATTFSGPAYLTGGNFGAEGSIVAVAVCSVATVAILIAALRRGQWVKVHLALNDRAAA